MSVHTYLNGELIRVAGTEEFIEGQIIQVEILPEASATYEGKIYQYIGATDTENNYIHGFFYECKSNGADPPTYSWKNIDVQDSSQKPIVYVTSLPVAPNIKDFIYALDTNTEITEEIVPDFLDTSEFFDKVGDRYIPKSTENLRVTDDEGKQIAYILNPTDAGEVTYHYIVDGQDYEKTITDTDFTYNVFARTFYAGDEENQTLTLLVSPPEVTDRVGRFEYDENGNITGEIFNTYDGASKNVASGVKSRASGYGNEAIGAYANANGTLTHASGEASTTIGYGTTASGNASFAAGTGTIANGAHSTAIGVYNQYQEILPTVEVTLELIDPNTQGEYYGELTEESTTEFDSISITAYSKPLVESSTGYGVKYKFVDQNGMTIAEDIIETPTDNAYTYKLDIPYPDTLFDQGYPAYIEIYCSDTDDYPHAVYRMETKGYLFAIGNGTDDTHRKNIVEVTDTVFNINGSIYQNGQPLDIGGSTIFVGTLAEWSALPLAEKTKYIQANIDENI